MPALEILPSELYPREERPLPPRLGASPIEWAKFRLKAPHARLGYVARQRIAKVKIVWELPQSPRKPKWRALEGSSELMDFYTPRSMSIKDVIAETAREHGVHQIALLGESRKHHLIVARAEAAYRLRFEKGLSMPQIGSFLGGRDHSTAINLIRRHCEFAGVDMPPGMRFGKKGRR